jgi:death-on-curing protein
METFLVLNGHEIDATVDAQERLMLELASGALSRDQLAAWLVKHARPRQ